MNEKTAQISSGLLLCMAIALPGCATNGMTRTEFLGNQEQLLPTRYDNVLMYRAPGFEPRRYAAVVVEDALIKTDSGRIGGLDDGQQREVLEHVSRELQRKESKPPALPGASGSVRVRVAVTELQTPNRAVNALTTLMVGPVTTGGASLEFEAIDGSTGRRIAAASCFERGSVLTEFAGAYTLLGHAKAAITTCIERIDSAWRDTSS